MVALIGNAIPFFLISFGETQVDAGLAAILMSTVPLTTVVLAHFFTHDEKLSTGKVVGVILGTIGVIVLVGPETLSGLGASSCSSWPFWLPQSVMRSRRLWRAICVISRASDRRL